MGEKYNNAIEYRNYLLASFLSFLRGYLTTELSIPYRWRTEGNNISLGEYLVSIREKLIGNLENNAKNKIDLTDNPNNSFYFIKTSGSVYSYEGINKETNILNKETKKNYTYKELIKYILNNPKDLPSYESLLIISKPPIRRGKVLLNLEPS